MKFEEKLIKLRKENLLSQEELAEKKKMINYSGGYYAKKKY